MKEIDLLGNTLQPRAKMTTQEPVDADLTDKAKREQENSLTASYRECWQAARRADIEAIAEAWAALGGDYQATSSKWPMAAKLPCKTE